MKRIIIFLLFLICSISILTSCKEKVIPEKELLSIEVSVPDGLTAFLGDIYVPNNIRVNAIYEDETKDVTAEATFSQLDTTSLGIKTVYVTYQEKQATYEVEVIRKTVEHSYRLRVKEEPIKMLYYLNDPIDFEGLELVMVMDDIEETPIALDLCDIYLSTNGVSKEVLDEVGTYEVAFTMKHLEVTYTTYIYLEVIYSPSDTPRDRLVIDEERSKLTYWTNEIFDPSTLFIYIMDAEDTTTMVPIESGLCTFTIFLSGIMVNEFSDEGKYSVRIEYANLYTTIEINVAYRRVEKKLVLGLESAKIYFSVGEAFSSSGLTIDYYEDDILKRRVSSVNCQFILYLNNIEKEYLDEPGTYSVVVDYEGTTEGYRIVVID